MMAALLYARRSFNPHSVHSILHKVEVRPLWQHDSTSSTSIHSAHWFIPFVSINLGIHPTSMIVITPI